MVWRNHKRAVELEDLLSVVLASPAKAVSWPELVEALKSREPWRALNLRSLRPKALRSVLLEGVQKRWLALDVANHVIRLGDAPTAHVCRENAKRDGNSNYMLELCTCLICGRRFHWLSPFLTCRCEVCRKA